MSAAAEALLAVLCAHLEPEAVAWLEGVLPRSGVPFERGRFFGAYAGAARRLPGALGATGEDEARLRAAGIAAPAVWSRSDAARAVLLLAACEATAPGEQLSIVKEAFRKGDSAERIAVLRVLSLLPGPERLVGLAAEACRTHVQDVFEALACENAFPARYLPDLAFRQLVLKAIFLGVPIERILGWRARNDAELRRMAADYAAERRAAGRTVPQDIALIDAPAEALP